MAAAIVLLFFCALPVFVGHKIGSPKGRAGWAWALFLGWVGVIIVSCLGPKPGSRAGGSRAGFSARTTGKGGQQMWPPAMPAALPPGWYADPAGGEFRRYWDGARWTEDLAPTVPRSQ